MFVGYFWAKRGKFCRHGFITMAKNLTNLQPKRYINNFLDKFKQPLSKYKINCLVIDPKKNILNKNLQIRHQHIFPHPSRRSLFLLRNRLLPRREISLIIADGAIFLCPLEFLPVLKCVTQRQQLQLHWLNNPAFFRQKIWTLLLKQGQSIFPKPPAYLPVSVRVDNCNPGANRLPFHIQNQPIFERGQFVFFHQKPRQFSLFPSEILIPPAARIFCMAQNPAAQVLQQFRCWHKDCSSCWDSAERPLSVKIRRT